MDYQQHAPAPSTTGDGRPPEMVAANSAEFGNIPQGSEGFGNVPKASESFRIIPNVSESFRRIPQGSEPKEYCTLTVREAARMFEAAGVARTERSIINWCQPNKMGVARLDNYFDPNERKYFISPQSVELAIQEEKSKAAKSGEPSEAPEPVPKGSEKPKPKASWENGEDPDRIKQLEREVVDLKILNQGKDYFIDLMKKERDGFSQDRQKYIDQLVASNRKVGELETRLLQLEGPEDERQH